MKAIIVILMLTGATAFCCGTYELDELPTHEDVVKLHLEAIKQGNKKLLGAAWDTDKAQIIEIKNGVSQKMDVNKTFDVWTKTKNPDLNPKIISTTKITEEIAVAKVSLNWKGSHYVEMLTLVKNKGNWKIVGKTYKAPRTASVYGG